MGKNQRRDQNAAPGQAAAASDPMVSWRPKEQHVVAHDGPSFLKLAAEFVNAVTSEVNRLNQELRASEQARKKLLAERDDLTQRATADSEKLRDLSHQVREIRTENDELKRASEQAKTVIQDKCDELDLPGVICTGPTVAATMPEYLPSQLFIPHPPDLRTPCRAPSVDPDDARRGSVAETSDSEDRDAFPLDADAEFPLWTSPSPSSLLVSSSPPDLPPTPMELCHVETPDELIYQHQPLNRRPAFLVRANTNSARLASPTRQEAPDAAAYLYGGGSQLGAPPEGSQPPGRGSFPGFVSLAPPPRQAAPDAAVYACGTGFQQGAPPEGSQHPGRGSFLVVPQQGGAQGPDYHTGAGPFGQPHAGAAPQCELAPAPLLEAPAVPAGIAGAGVPSCPPPASLPPAAPPGRRPSASQPPASAPKLEQPPVDAAAAPPQRGEQPPPEGGAASSAGSADRCAQARIAQAPALGLQHELSGEGGVCRVRWTVHAKTLNSTDKDIVSRPFELNVAGPVNFKLALFPSVTSDTRLNASFRRAKGRGRVTLMCTDAVRTETKVQFRIAVGSASSEDQQPRGPVTHDFFDKRVACLPTGSDQWDFKKMVDASTETFTVCLEIWPASD